MVSCDSTLLSQIKSALHGHTVSLDLRQDAASAIELASRRHLDGLFIDCDNVIGGAEMVAKVRNSRSNRETLVIAVVNGLTSVEAALDLGANFVLGKPIPEARLRGVLDIALPKMEREHRRYFRYQIDLPVQLCDHIGQPVAARIKNLSEGGLAVKTTAPVHLEGVVRLEFDLPSIEPQTFHAKAEVVWRDSFEMGLRFLHVEKDSGVAFQSWLRLLEAQSLVGEWSQHLH